TGGRTGAAPEPAVEPARRRNRFGRRDRAGARSIRKRICWSERFLPGATETCPEGCGMAESMIPADGAPAGPWDPWRQVQDLQSRFDELFDGAFGALGGGGWRSPADLTETFEAYVIELDVPGLRADDLTIESSGAELRVRGGTAGRPRGGWSRGRTRRIGRFAYRISLPADADPDRITAELADGVLTIRVAKRDTAGPRRIEITTG
ncbi:Hsp20/alpha crystallin family protein, partial [Actinoplanes teichomyceticus]